MAYLVHSPFSPRCSIDSGAKSNDPFPLESLIQKFSSFKGIGRKTAQRLALESIMMPEDAIQSFASELVRTKKDIRFCEDCFYLTWETTCHICLDATRSTDTICVVSEPKDVLSIEKSNRYKGLYHVLGGVVSPLDGIYPDMLRCSELVDRVKAGGIRQVILALNPTVEGDTTMMYLSDILSTVEVRVFKLAQGIPIGADLGYLDEVTIGKAFDGMLPL